VNNKREGQGKIYTDQGVKTFQGTLTNSVRVEGTVYDDEKGQTAVYTGQFDKDGTSREGHGITYEADGKTVKYDGNFLDNTFDGQGKMFESGVLSYSGGWKAGVRHGQGKMYFADGSVMHEGFFVEGKYQPDATEMPGDGSTDSSADDSSDSSADDSSNSSADDSSDSSTDGSSDSKAADSSDSSAADASDSSAANTSDSSPDVATESGSGSSSSSPTSLSSSPVPVSGSAESTPASLSTDSPPHPEVSSGQ